jgi:hypothetical protein
MKHQTCKADTCTRSCLHVSGYCIAHRKQFARTGKTHPIGEDRFVTSKPFAFIRRALSSKTDECIVWPFATTGHGGNQYGIVKYDQIDLATHRLVCMFQHGVSEDGWALHSCHNSLCINPRHLYWGDRSQNMRDRWSPERRAQID